MRIPSDIPLAVYIKRLIKADNVEQFYQTDEWKELRQDVLEFFHFECQECLKKGDYTKADCVHHVNEVRVRPDLALSKTYVDPHGKQQYQLVPLCNACHSLVHDKVGQMRHDENRFTNEEKW